MTDNLRKILSFILALMLLASAVMLPSCRDNVTPPPVETDGGEDATDLPVSEEPAGTDLPEVTEPPMLTDPPVTTDAPESEETTAAPVVLPVDFELTPSVTVVYSYLSGKSLEKALAERLAADIKEHLGFDCAVATDWNHDTRDGAEIIIGGCSRRADTLVFTDDFYSDGYGYSVLSSTMVSISACDKDNLEKAVDLFVEEVIKSKETVLEIGREKIINDRPDVNYTINGEKLENFVIVAQKSDEAAVNAFKAYCKEALYTKLKVVTPEEYRGGDAIMIGNYGAKSYGGYRYVIRSSVENGDVIVTVDGDSPVLRNQGLKLLREEYMSDGFKSEKFVIPEERSVYVKTASGDHRLVLTDCESEELRPGVTYYRKTYDNSDGNNVDVYIVAVSGDSEATFATYVADFDTHSGKAKLDVKTVGVQALLLEGTGVDVIAATNAGYFHKSAGTNYPYGMQIVDGKVVWEPDGSDKVHGDNWVGVTYDGKIVCGNAADYKRAYNRNKLQYGIACGSYIMKFGKLNMQRVASGFSPMTAIALTSDGGFVLVCVDGRTSRSAGVSFFDTVKLFWDLGLDYTDAYILDGGGSTEMVLETSGKRFATQNRPSDGSSRPVGDIIAVVIPK